MKGVYWEGWKDEQIPELVFQGGVSACIRTGYRSKSVAVDDLWSFAAWLWLLCCMYYEWELFLWPVCCMSTNFVCWHLLCMIWIASLCMFICETFNNEIRFDYYLHSDSHLNAYIFLIWNLLSMPPLFIPVVYFEQCLKYKRPLLSFYIFVLSILFFYNCFEQLLVCPFHSPKPIVFPYINGHLYTLL
jgi:hypothetical protein